MKTLMYEHPSAELLVERAQSGDHGAFERLVESHRERVRRFVASRAKLYLGPQIDPDEIAHETFVTAFGAISRFQWQSDGSFFRWLCGIAKNQLMKTAERAQEHDRLGDDEDARECGESPSKSIRRDERLSRLQQAVDDLPADYAKVVRLARIDGLRIKQIAERMDRSTDSVKHLLARALIRLRDSFGDTESLSLANRTLEFPESSDE